MVCLLTIFTDFSIGHMTSSLGWDPAVPSTVRRTVLCVLTTRLRAALGPCGCWCRVARFPCTHPPLTLGDQHPSGTVNSARCCTEQRLTPPTLCVQDSWPRGR